MGEGGRRDNCVCKGGPRLILGFFLVEWKKCTSSAQVFCMENGLLYLVSSLLIYSFATGMQHKVRLFIIKNFWTNYLFVLIWSFPVHYRKLNDDIRPPILLQTRTSCKH